MKWEERKVCVGCGADSYSARCEDCTTKHAIRTGPAGDVVSMFRANNGTAGVAAKEVIAMRDELAASASRVASLERRVAEAEAKLGEMGKLERELDARAASIEASAFSSMDRYACEAEADRDAAVMIRTVLSGATAMEALDALDCADASREEESRTRTDDAAPREETTR